MLIFSSQPAWFFGCFFSHFPVARGSLTHFLKLPWCLIFFYAERMRPGNSLPCFLEITSESARTLPAWEHVVLTQDLLLFLQVWRSPFLHFLHPSYKSSQRNSNCQLPPLSFGAAEFTAGTRTKMTSPPWGWRESGEIGGCWTPQDSSATKTCHFNSSTLKHGYLNSMDR